MTYLTAFLLATGSAPGSPMQTGQQRLFGSPPNAFRHPQNILLAVKSSAWTSIPITASYSGITITYLKTQQSSITDSWRYLALSFKRSTLNVTFAPGGN